MEPMPKNCVKYSPMRKFANDNAAAATGHVLSSAERATLKKETSIKEMDKGDANELTKLATSVEQDMNKTDAKEADTLETPTATAAATTSKAALTQLAGEVLTLVETAAAVVAAAELQANDKDMAKVVEEVLPAAENAAAAAKQQQQQEVQQEQQHVRNELQPYDPNIAQVQGYLANFMPHPILPLNCHVSTTLRSYLNAGQRVQKRKRRRTNSLSNFKCNLCQNKVTNAVITICGHLYCWPCLWMHVRAKIGRAVVCPHCKRALQLHEDIVPYYGGQDCDDSVLINSIPGMIARPSAFRFPRNMPYSVWFSFDDQSRRLPPDFTRRALYENLKSFKAQRVIEHLSRIENIIMTCIGIFWLLVAVL